MYPGRTCTPRLVIFMTKHKNLGKSLRELLLSLMLKNVAGGNVPCFPPPGRVKYIV